MGDKFGAMTSVIPALVTEIRRRRVCAARGQGLKGRPRRRRGLSDPRDRPGDAASAAPSIATQNVAKRISKGQKPLSFPSKNNQKNLFHACAKNRADNQPIRRG
jgi:hypothetical protein